MLSNIQLLQDLLSDRMNISIVLVDDKLREFTLPSRIPLVCHERLSFDGHCKECAATSVGKLAGDERASVLYVCPNGFALFVLRTNVICERPLYLIAGRSADPDALSEHLPLLCAIFGLPVNLSALPGRTAAAFRRHTGKTAAFHLTNQELFVLGLMTKGLTNQDIAAKLFISLNTVKTHIAHILAKLNVANRTEAALVAIRNNLAEGHLHGPGE
jgi:DNA-binding CsgD family transcriptional regulator